MKVTRKWAWKDFKSSLQRARELNVHVKVQFVGESAIDEGGPRCELFCPVDRMVSNELMQGEDGTKKRFFTFTFSRMTVSIMHSLRSRS